MFLLRLDMIKGTDIEVIHLPDPSWGIPLRIHTFFLLTLEQGISLIAILIGLFFVLQLIVMVIDPCFGLFELDPADDSVVLIDDIASLVHSVDEEDPLVGVVDQFLEFGH